VRGDIQRRADATHLEFRGLNRWPYELRKVSPKEYSLILPAFDDATVAGLQSWSDSLITEVRVKKEGPDGNFEVVFKVSDESVESFNYLTDDPSRLIIDFYKQAPDQPEANLESAALENPKVEKSKAASKLPPKKKSKKRRIARGDGYQKVDRKPAGDERLEVQNPKPAESSPESRAEMGGAFDAADPNFDRFRIKGYEIREEAIIASEQSVYIHFPMLKMPTSLTDSFVKDRPEFDILPKNSQENKEARLLLALYKRQLVADGLRNQDRIGAFLKVYDHFTKTYPNSEYDEIIKNLAGHIYYMRYQISSDPLDRDQHMNLFKYLVNKYPKSSLAERNRLWLAYAALDRGDGLSVIKEFQDYQFNYPNSIYSDAVQLALAEGYLILNKFDDALKIYRDQEEQGKTAEARVEAVYRQGDVFFAKKDYASAISTYQRALDKFPKLESKFENLHYNLAESLFWQRQFKESLDNHIRFLTLFPNHVYGGYAMTRAGELLEAMGADRQKVMGAFLESYFRYRKSPGAEVARIRMLSQQMTGMKEKELRKATSEMKAIAKMSPLPEINEFAVLMIADGYQKRNDNRSALDHLIAFYQSNPTSKKLNLFRAKIVRNISEQMNQEVDRVRFTNALKLYGKYSKTWLKTVDRMDIPYFVGRAYEQAGVYGEAKKIYTEVLERRDRIQGSKEERERKVNEILPSIETLRLRLARVAVETRDYPGAFQQISEIKKWDGLTGEEGIERILLLARVLREKGQIDQAKGQLRELLKVWKGDPSAVVESQIELASLEVKSNDPNEAEKRMDYVLTLSDQGAELDPSYVATALELKGDAQLAQSKSLAAVETYQILLEKFEGTRPLGSIRYRIGEILYNKGDVVGAEKVWAGLDKMKYAVLRRLADERLESGRWRSENKKYIERIPAMEGFMGVQ